MHRKTWRLPAIVCSAAALWIVAEERRAVADLIDFTQIAGPNTASPSGGGNFTGFALPTIENGTVYFYGGTAGNATLGIYSNSGGMINTIADTTTPIPGGSGNFGFLSAPSVSGGTVAFTGGVNNSNEGVYTVSTSGGALTRIADQSTTAPDEVFDNTFNSFGGATTNGGTVAFKGEATFSGEGIYSQSGGTLTKIVDLSTDIPGAGGANFQHFSQPSLAENGTLVFRGNNGFEQPSADDNFEGIYTSSGGILSTVADTETPMPNESVEFDDFGDTSIDGDGTVAFRAEGPDPADPNALTQGGVYTSDGGSLDVIADLNTAAPDGGNFLAFFGGNTPIDGNNVAFTAFHGSLATPSTIEEGLYFSRDGVLSPLLHVGDTLDGRVIEFIFLGREAMEGNTLAFLVQFDDPNSLQAVYTATVTPASVPEPSSMLLLGLTGLLGAGIGWRRRRNVAIAA